MTMDMIEAALRMAEEGEMETDDITGHHGKSTQGMETTDKLMGLYDCVCTKFSL